MHEVAQWNFSSFFFWLAEGLKSCFRGVGCVPLGFRVGVNSLPLQAQLCRNKGCTPLRRHLSRLPGLEHRCSDAALFGNIQLPPPHAQLLCIFLTCRGLNNGYMPMLWANIPNRVMVEEMSNILESYK